MKGFEDGETSPDQLLVLAPVITDKMLVKKTLHLADKTIFPQMYYTIIVRQLGFAQNKLVKCEPSGSEE